MAQSIDINRGLLHKNLAVFLEQTTQGKGKGSHGVSYLVSSLRRLRWICSRSFSKRISYHNLLFRPPIFSFEIVEDVFENKTTGNLLTARAQGSKGGEKRRPRLRVVHHLPLGIVERPKRKLA